MITDSSDYTFLLILQEKSSLPYHVFHKLSTCGVIEVYGYIQWRSCGMSAAITAAVHISTLIAASVTPPRLSAPPLRQPRCFLVSPPWKTSMGCQNAFPKPASVPGQNCARCTAWTCPTLRWTVAAALCPGAWPLHPAFAFPPA